MYLSRRLIICTMKRLPFYFWVSLALASCQGGKEAVNQALPVIDMNGDYRKGDRVAGYC